MSKQIDILVIDSSAIIRSGFITLLHSALGDNCQVQQGEDISAFTSPSTSMHLDLLIVNPILIGAYPIKQIRSNVANSNVKIIALQSSFHPQALLQDYDEVISVFDNQESIEEKITKAMVDEDQTEKKRELSAREKEIIVCIVKGLSNKQIAEKLCLSTHTVIAHRRNITTKLQIHSPAGLTIYAIVNKLVDLKEIRKVDL